jgi:predicted RNase H-like nuclease (RuvC/YqgF family)
VEEVESVENEENMIATLEKLRQQINALKIEKERVIESEEKLRAKIESEIEAKRSNIEKLKAEIPILKQRCEKLANVLQIPVCK